MFGLNNHTNLPRSAITTYITHSKSFGDSSTCGYAGVVSSIFDFYFPDNQSLSQHVTPSQGKLSSLSRPADGWFWIARSTAV